MPDVTYLNKTAGEAPRLSMCDFLVDTRHSWVKQALKLTKISPASSSNPVGIYLFKVNNRSTRTRCEICSKLTIKTPERELYC